MQPFNFCRYHVKRLYNIIVTMSCEYLKKMFTIHCILFCWSLFRNVILLFTVDLNNALISQHESLNMTFDSDAVTRRKMWSIYKGNFPPLFYHRPVMFALFRSRLLCPWKFVSEWHQRESLTWMGQSEITECFKQI